MSDRLTAQAEQEMRAQAHRQAHEKIMEILIQIARAKEPVPTHLHGQEAMKRAADNILDLMRRDGLLQTELVLKDGRKVRPMPLSWLVNFLRENEAFLVQVYGSYFLGPKDLDTTDLPEVIDADNVSAAKAEA